MDHRIDTQMEELRKTVLSMGSYVESAVGALHEALKSSKTAGLQKVHENEIQINQLQMRVDDQAWMILAQQGPVARDLRQVLSNLKMNADLERMGDQAVNIAYFVKEYFDSKDVLGTPELVRLAELVQLMIQKSLNAFMNNDVVLAHEILSMDDQVDRAKDGIIEKIKEKMQLDSSWVDDGLKIIFMAKNLERLGDHTTNIAEEVIFTVTGDDVRHQGKHSAGK